MIRAPSIVPMWAALPASVCLVLGVLWLRRKPDGTDEADDESPTTDGAPATTSTTVATRTVAIVSESRPIANGTGNNTAAAAAGAAASLAKSSASSFQLSAASPCFVPAAANRSSASSSLASPPIVNLGKSAPIDIQPTRCAPVKLTNFQIDRDILKVPAAVARQASNNNNNDDDDDALDEGSYDARSLTGSSSQESDQHRAFACGQRTRTVKEGAPVVIKATVEAKISPENSFAEAKYEEARAVERSDRAAALLPANAPQATAAAAAAPAEQHSVSLLDADISWADEVEAELLQRSAEQQQQQQQPPQVAAVEVAATSAAVAAGQAKRSRRRAARAKKQKQLKSSAEQGDGAAAVAAAASSAAAAHRHPTPGSSLGSDPALSADSGQGSGSAGGSIDDVRHSIDSGSAGSSVATTTTAETPLTEAARQPRHFHFAIAGHLVGSMVGRKYCFILEVQQRSKCAIAIRRHPHRGHQQERLVCLDGTQAQVQAALALIAEKLQSAQRFRVVSLRHADVSHDKERDEQRLHLELLPNANNAVAVTAVVNGGHCFVQLVEHETWRHLQRMEQTMCDFYEGNRRAPLVPAELLEPKKLRQLNVCTICVARFEGGWWRVQVLAGLDEERNERGEIETYAVKFLDYGGFASVRATDMRMICEQFMQLRFQAVECVLANVEPRPGDNETVAREGRGAVNGALLWKNVGAHQLRQLTRGRQAVAHVLGYNADGLPAVRLFVRERDGTTVFVNKELVAKGIAQWSDFGDERDLVSYPQINHNTTSNNNNNTDTDGEISSSHEAKEQQQQQQQQSQNARNVAKRRRARNNSRQQAV